MFCFSCSLRAILAIRRSSTDTGGFGTDIGGEDEPPMYENNDWCACDCSLSSCITAAEGCIIKAILELEVLLLTGGGVSVG